MYKTPRNRRIPTKNLTTPHFPPTINQRQHPTPFLDDHIPQSPPNAPRSSLAACTADALGPRSYSTYTADGSGISPFGAQAVPGWEEVGRGDGGGGGWGAWFDIWVFRRGREGSRWKGLDGMGPGGAGKRKKGKGVFVGEGFGAQKRVFRESNVMLLATTKVLLVIHAPDPLNPTTSNPFSGQL